MFLMNNLSRLSIYQIINIPNSLVFVNNACELDLGKNCLAARGARFPTDGKMLSAALHRGSLVLLVMS